MIGWRERLAPRVTTCDTRAMKSLDIARATIAGSAARRVATDIFGGILISPTPTHLLARRARVEWWDLPAEPVTRATQSDLTRWSL